MTEPSSYLAPLLRPELAELAPYSPHPGSFPIRLDANEAPPLLSETARSRLAQVAAQTSWALYPDAAMTDLRAALAERCGVRPEQVLAGVGSDEIITLLLTALSRSREGADSAVMLTTTPTFVMYRMSARVRGQRVLEVPLDADWDLSVDGVAAALRVAEPNVLFISSPNNPTGNCMSRDRLEAVIQLAKRSLVVVDEAYIDYSDRDQLSLFHEHENVAILRTLSKVGFAALRVGWIVGRAELIRELDKIRLPYNLSTLAQRLATVAVRELAPEVESTARTVIAERERVHGELAKLPGVRVTPSQANFLWVRGEVPAETAFKALSAQGILVRSFHERGGRLAQQFRVTIGTTEQNDAFLQAYRKLV